MSSVKRHDGCLVGEAWVCGDCGNGVKFVLRGHADISYISTCKFESTWPFRLASRTAPLGIVLTILPDIARRPCIHPRDDPAHARVPLLVCPCPSYAPLLSYFLSMYIFSVVLRLDNHRRLVFADRRRARLAFAPVENKPHKFAKETDVSSLRRKSRLRGGFPGRRAAL